MTKQTNWIERFEEQFTWDKKGGTLMSSDAKPIKEFFTSELLKIKTGILEAMEKEKGNGKVISGSLGPLYDWGCTQGYDLALKKVLEIVEKNFNK